MDDEEWAVIAGAIAEEAAAAVSAPFAAHTYDAVRADLLAEGGLGGGLLRGEAEDGMGLGYDGQVDGLRREMGGLEMAWAMRMRVVLWLGWTAWSSLS